MNQKTYESIAFNHKNMIELCFVVNSLVRLGYRYEIGTLPPLLATPTHTNNSVFLVINNNSYKLETWYGVPGNDEFDRVCRGFYGPEATPGNLREIIKLYQL